MHSLELRRMRFDLIYVYKLLFGMVDADVSALFVANNVAVSYTHLTLPTKRIV